MSKMLTIVGITVFVVLFSACSGPLGSGSGKNDGSNNGGGTTPGNEGSVASPVELTVGVSRQVKVGKGVDNATTSYYKFTAPVDDTYTITGSNFAPSPDVTGFTAVLYSVSDYSSGGSASDPYVTNFDTSPLTNGTTYYLKFINLYDSSLNVTFDLIIEATP